MLLLNHNKILQFYNVKLGKVHSLKDLIVAVIRNDIFSLSTDGTINKLVIIRICFYKIKVPCRAYTNKIITIDKGLYDNVSEIWRSLV